MDSTLEIGAMKAQLAEIIIQKEAIAREVMKESDLLCIKRQQEEAQEHIGNLFPICMLLQR